MIRGLLLVLTILIGSAASASPEKLRSDFVQRMTTEHGFDASELDTLLDGAKVSESILEAIARPAEKRLNWSEYRKIFLTRDRIRGGLDYWERNADILERARATYGVPPEIIVAIVGVETRYGRFTGRYRVLDALTTLGFHYPPRADFFRGELEHFLLLSREEGVDPSEPLGSYAGAMGRPQFIPSSYRAYAVDFDGDHKRDIWQNDADVIGSVASYFARHGWRSDAPVTQRVMGIGPQHQPLIDAGYKPHRSVAAFAEDGIHSNPTLPPELEAALVELETDEEPQHWLVLPNFYVITRYNRSKMYAMAVYQLADAIKRLRTQVQDG